MFEGREVLGESCTAVNYPATFKLMQGVTTDMRIMEFTVKYHLLRARPYVWNPNWNPYKLWVRLLCKWSYPLGLYSSIYVSELLSDKREQFLDLAYEIGESREIKGIHTVTRKQPVCWRTQC